MNRKVLLVEPNYKNKYPPMGLMKIATYYRMKGDDVRFFKGNLMDLVADITVDDLLDNLKKYDPDIYWKKYKIELLNYVRRKSNQIIEVENDITKDLVALNLVVEARKYYRNKGYFKNPPFDRVGITTLFTFYWDITIDTINFVKKLCKSPDGVMVGGVASTILPDRFYEATGIKPWIGQLSHPGDLDPGDPLIIDELPLDYSILEEIDYKYPASNAYFAYMTRGCINKCSFCAVPTLEPEYKGYIGLKSRIEITKKRFGEMRDLLLLDNNVFASKQFNQIIDEIKECGFQKGATYLPPNQYEIAIRNLRDNYNNRAYIRKIIGIYKQLIDKLSQDEKASFYVMLEDRYCLVAETASREAILEMDEYVAPLYDKYFVHNRKVKRIVDFNQGLDSRLATDDIMEKLSEININPTRIAFDHWELRSIYEQAIRTAAKHGIVNLSNYLLYNYHDRPDDLYHRLKLNIDLCEELGINIYSFPMKYHPIDDPMYFSNRDYIGKHWNRKFIRTIQCILNSTKGKVGRKRDFFNEAFGESIERFHTLLWMPELFIIYRFEFKDNLAYKWEKDFNGLSSAQRSKISSIIANNTFKEIEWDLFDDMEKRTLFYYTLSKEEAIIQKERLLSNTECNSY